MAQMTIKYYACKLAIYYKNKKKIFIFMRLLYLVKTKFRF